MNNKPVVTFKAGYINELHDGKRVATLFDVKGHPALGDPEVVHTSLIVKVHDNGDIETLNTIYRPEADEAPADDA